MNGKHIYTEKELYNKYSSLCAGAEYCCFDIRKKMQRLEVSEELADKVLQHLQKEQFIDERRYARAFVRDKFRYNRWGRTRIQQELRMKGVPQLFIDDALEEISEDDSYETLLSLLQKKLPSVKGKNGYEIKMKLMRFAMSRGFDADMARRIVEEELSVGDGIDD
jgi:regulatory protein